LYSSISEAQMARRRFPKRLRIDTTAVQKTSPNSMGADTDVYNEFALGEQTSSNPFALSSKTINKSISQFPLEQIEPAKPNRLQLLEVANKKPIDSAKGWFLFVLIIITGYLTLLFSVYREEIIKTCRGFINLNYFSLEYRLSKKFSFSSLLLYLLFFISLGVFAYQILGNKSITLLGAPYLDLPLCILGVCSIWIFKHLQLAFLSIFFPFSDQVSFWNSLLSNTNKTLGIILVPFLFFIQYTPQYVQSTIITITISILVIGYVYCAIKALTVTAGYIMYNKFHFLIYLLAVEIAPIVVLVKYLS
jgi:hypothetical protein